MSFIYQKIIFITLASVGGVTQSGSGNSDTFYSGIKSVQKESAFYPYQGVW